MALRDAGMEANSRSWWSTIHSRWSNQGHWSTPLPVVKYVMEPKPGLNFARNRALKESTGQMIAFIDDDVTVDRHWLEGLRRAIAQHPDAAAFTGLVLSSGLATEAQILFERGGGFEKASKPSGTVRPCPETLFILALGGNWALGATWLS